ncbi:tyrosine-type recombinase/integrase [Paraburkholderia sp. USG1]|uniref:tyrosine-type recombinase/integrase n=1 Tax=Paraburkholderia sp. USG1 TaxID=2952268 RepID=UPI00285E969F|nr:tyrosine-type recombinase/integrase [Paraburkholderia sp. USG1]MDR8399224.1 tyrosine-type recombinase/integrase [Paraburkholderia sp. USG1]
MGNLTMKAVESLGGDKAVSDAMLRKAKPRDKPYKIMAGNGLQLRVATDGGKSWLVRFTVKGGKEQQYRLPENYGSGDGYLSLKDALARAAHIQALARQGIDYPASLVDARMEKEKAHIQALTEALAVQDLFNIWIGEISVKRGKRGRGDGGRETTRALEKDVLPFIGKTLLTQITKNDVLAAIRRVSDRGHNRLAVMLLRDTKQMFRYGEKNQPYKRLLSESDILSIDDEDVIHGEYNNVRTRVLSAEEIVLLRDKMPDSGLTTVVKAAIWVMLGCMTRVGETVAARWEHVDLQARTWSIPKENTKTQTAIVVHLSDFVLRQFKALWVSREKLDVEKRSDWVFPSRTDRAKPLNSQTVGKALADRQRGDGEPIKGRTEKTDALKLANPETWKCHDLRRTGATQMQVAGIKPEIVHRCLNHAPINKLDAVYLLFEYEDDMKAAWCALGDKLDALLGNNVIVGNFAQSA